jgi:hypothetical protein
VRLSPLGTSTTNWPIVPAPDDRWWWMWSSRWNETCQGKPKYSEKTCPSATLSTTNPTWPALVSKPTTNRLSYDTAWGRSRLAFRVLLVRNEKVNDVLTWSDCVRTVKRGLLYWTRHVIGMGKQEMTIDSAGKPSETTIWETDWKIER